MSQDKNMHNKEFQDRVLKLLCVNLEFAQSYSTLLKQEYFENTTARIIFQIADEYVLTYEKELTLDDLLVAINEHVSKKGYTSDTYDLMKDEAKTIFSRHINSEQFIIDKLITFARQQEFRAALFKCVDIMEQDGPIEEALRLIDVANSIGLDCDEGYEFEDILGISEIYRENYHPSKLVKIGIPSFDHAMLGGMAPGEVHIIQGNPKSGKSTFGACVGAYNASIGKTVFHATLEISKADAAIKYAARMSGMTYSDIINADMGKKYKDAMLRYRDIKPSLFIKHWPEGTANTLHLRAWISKKRARTGKNPNLIIVDYDDCLVPVSGEREDMYNNSGNIYKDLIQLASYFKCPLLTFAQPKLPSWEKPNRDELLGKQDLAHSARKAHRSFSMSSLNFKDGAENGILYISDARRGISHKKIPLKRDLSRAFFTETSGVTS